MANSKRDVPKELPSSLSVTKDNMAALFSGLSRLVSREVLVGFPEGEDNERKAEPGEPEGLTNAALGYIHDNGSEDAKIPARPFMVPGLESVKEETSSALAGAARVAMSARGGDAVEQRLHRAGSIAANGIKAKVNEGVPPPLADATVRARARRGRKGAKEELERRSQGEAPGTDLAKPLVDTAQMRNAITYAIRNREAE